MEEAEAWVYSSLVFFCCVPSFLHLMIQHFIMLPLLLLCISLTSSSCQCFRLLKKIFFEFLIYPLFSSITSTLFNGIASSL